MKLDFLFVNQKDIHLYRDEILKLLHHCDKDFVPPLTKRNSSYQGDFNNETKATDIPLSYLEDLLEQHFIFAMHNENIVAFLSFIHNYTDEILDLPSCNYATTTCVYMDYRKKGIAQQLYLFLERNIPKDLQLMHIARRTWSTNYSQLHLYQKLDYQLVGRLLNHRGENIDTLYYAKEIDLTSDYAS